MRPKKHETTGSADLFRARLEQIINMKNELAQLAVAIDWNWIDGEIAPLRACGWRTKAVRCEPVTLSESRSTPRCNPRTSASRPMPSCCM